MDISKVLRQLRDELNYLDAAILSIERLQGVKSRRGRPPAVLADLQRPPAKPKATPKSKRSAPRE
jgi:hypothetical protein